MRLFKLGLPVALLLLATPRLAAAQQAAADALFDSARAAMDRGDFAAACEQFRASDKLDAAAGTEPRSFAVRLSEGDGQKIVVAPGSATFADKGPRGAASAPASGTAAPGDQASKGSSRRVLGFSFAGVGVAGLGVGTVAGLL